jgi:hypothetical protein
MSLWNDWQASGTISKDQVENKDTKQERWMGKIDLKRELKKLYQPPAGKVVTVEVPKMNYLMVDGEGDPNGSKTFQEAVGSLFSVSYTLKFMVKKSSMGIDYGVMPLEGLFWSDNMADFSGENKADWKWTLMIMQPKYVSAKNVEMAIAEVKKKKGLSGLSNVRFEEFEEGISAQIMHIGPFSEEGPTIEKVHAYIEELGAMRCGKHHEIYLTDIRRADPRNWKTVVRQPMKTNLGVINMKPGLNA